MQIAITQLTMKKIYTACKALPLVMFFAFLLQTTSSNAQCTRDNATSCFCPNPDSTNCYLLPDIKVARRPINLGQFTEHAPRATWGGFGRLNVTVSTPNIGFGPLEVVTIDDDGYRHFVCGTDTIRVYDPNYTINFTCPNLEEAKQIAFQRMFKKQGNTMVKYLRNSGNMTYHPTHGHMHVDDWGTYTLRIRDENISDPRQWPLVGTGSKLGFCLMDLSNCQSSLGDCVSNNGQVLSSANFPNYGLGIRYNCSPQIQGISSGYVDIYSQNLDGMWVNIPPNTCNGQYWLVVEVDPNNNFIESDETNNVEAFPITLNRQGGNSQPLRISGINSFCEGQSTTLTAQNSNRVIWSTGDTSRSITVTQPGRYSVRSLNQVCSQQQGNKDSVEVAGFNVDTIGLMSTVNACVLNPITTTLPAHYMNASWYVSSGATDIRTIQWPRLNGDTLLYYRMNQASAGAKRDSVGLRNPTIGTAVYSTGNFGINFSALNSLSLRTVDIYASIVGNRTIQIRNSANQAIFEKTVNITSQGKNTIELNAFLTAGNNYFIGFKQGTLINGIVNTSNVLFPYLLANVLQLNNGTGGATLYPYFYNFVVSESRICQVGPLPVMVRARGVIPAIANMDSNYVINQNPITLTPQPAGAVFSGPHISSSGTLVPPATPGRYMLTCTYYDGVSTCTVTSTAYYNVNLPTALGSKIAPTKIFPNPSTGLLHLEPGAFKDQQARIEIRDAQGRLVLGFDKKLSSELETLSLSPLKDGLYSISIKSKEASWHANLSIVK